jgi:hypothetical protein
MAQDIKLIVLDQENIVIAFGYAEDIINEVNSERRCMGYDYDGSPLKNAPQVGWRYDQSTQEFIPKFLPLCNQRKIAILDQNNIVVNLINENEIAIDNKDYLEPNSIPLPEGYNEPGYASLEFDYEGSPLRNYPQIGWTYDATKNGFISPKPEVYYTLNDLTWEIDSSQPYDLHGNGELYQYDAEYSVWNRVN